MAQKQAPTIDIYEGTAKESGKSFKALRVTIGQWSQLVFPKSRFEMDYIIQYMDELKLLNEFDSTEDQK